MDPVPGDAPQAPRRRIVFWISRVLAGALGTLMIVNGILTFASGDRGSGVQTFAIGLLFAFYGFGGGSFRWRRAPAARTTTPEGNQPPKPIE
jgi:hypothetical protein